MAALLKAALWCARWVSSKGALRLGFLLGGLMYRLNTDAAKTARANLRFCFPELDENQLEGLIRQRLTQIPLLFFEFAQLAYWPLPRLLQQIETIEGEGVLQQAFASEQGVLLLVPHHGNWEILCAFLGANYSVAALYDPPKQASLESTIVDARQRYQGQMFPIDTAGMRNIMRTLKAGKLIAVLPDQVPSRESGVYANFFGQPALTMTLAHKLIQRSHPNVLLGVVERVFTEDADYQYKLSFKDITEAVDVPDVETSTGAMNAAIEKAVLNNPEQYQWEYKRFKRPPKKGQGNIYRRQ